MVLIFILIYFEWRDTENQQLRFYPHRVSVCVCVGGGGRLMEPLPRVFEVLQYFETILPLVESL